MRKKIELNESSNLADLAKQLGQVSVKGDYALPKQSAREKRKQLLFVAGGVVAIAAVFTLLGIFFNPFRRPEAASKVVPNVVGMKEGTAREAIATLKLRVVAEYDPQSVKAPGTVVATHPAAGQKVAIGGDVVLKIAGNNPLKKSSTGAQTPATTGIATSGVANQLPKTVGPSTTTTPPTPATSSTPPATGSVTPAATEKPVMPDVEGKVYEKAARELTAAGLRPMVVYVRDVNQPDRIVLTSDPRPGAPVEKGAIVKLQVNSLQATGAPTAGAGLIAVENFVGRTEAEASSKLRAKGLEPVIAYESTRMQPAGFVVRMNPPAGSQLPPKTQVTLTVAR
ncbi:MAG: PASTA domain-containing protein [Armatimonadota bacterium]